MDIEDYTRLVDDLRDHSEIVIGFANLKGSVNSILVLSYDRPEELYYLTHAVRMQYRDGSFMQWSWESRWHFETEEKAKANFRIMI
jgi:hypothetical protein